MIGGSRVATAGGGGMSGGADPLQEIINMRGKDIAAMMGLPPQAAAIWDQMPPEMKIQLAQQVMAPTPAYGQGQTSVNPIEQQMMEQLAKGSGR